MVSSRDIALQRLYQSVAQYHSFSGRCLVYGVPATLTASDISSSYQATLNKMAGNDAEDVVVASLPKVFHLYQNHPNPFNPITTIRFDIPEKTHATLTIFNIVGQKVATLLDGNVEPGFQSVKWDATRLSSGIYFYVLHAGTYHSARKMAVVK